MKKLSIVREVESINELSTRTIRKILSRLRTSENLGCSNCGFDKCVGDIHHICGRKIENADHHDNLCYLCPNCHRMFHEGSLKKEDLINLTTFLGDRWKKFYGYALSEEFKEEIIKEARDNKEAARVTRIIEKQNENESFKKKVLESEIDFKKRGYGTKLSFILNRSSQNCIKWAKKNMPEKYL
jgi:hypothetical protein